MTIKNSLIAFVCLAGLARIVFATDALQPLPVDVLAKNGNILAFRSGETWHQLDMRSGKVRPMRPLGLAPDMPCVMGGFTILRGQINGADILDKYNPPVCVVVDSHTVMMGGAGLPDVILQWPLGVAAIALDRKEHALYDISRYFSAERNNYWIASAITGDEDVSTGQWALCRYPDGLTVRPPECIVASFEAMRDCVFIGTPNGLLKIAIPSGECILYAEREHINGIEKKLRNSLNWTHVITGSLQIKGRTLYCGYFNQPGGIASFIISRDKHSGEMSYMPVPIAGLHRMVLLDKHRIALAGCALKKYGEEEYAYFGGMAIYNVRTASITVVNDDPVSNISLSSGTMVVERILGAGVDMALMEREVIKYSASTMEELSRDYEEAGLDEPEKYDALKKIHDAVLAGRTDIPEAKHSAIVARRLAQKAIVTTEQIPARIVPITDKVRQKIENGN